MRRHTGLCLAAVLLCAGPAAAQETAPPAPSLERIELQLAAIAETLAELRDEQRVMRTLRRLELAERRLEPKRAEIRDARDAVRARKEEIGHLESISASFRDQMQQAIADGANPLDAPGREEVAHFDLQLETLRGQLEEAERRVLEAEDELTYARREADALDDALRDLVESLDD